MESMEELSALVAEGGLEAVNLKIASLIEELRTGGLSPEASRERRYHLNDLLYGAIYVCPHLARSVEVSFQPGFYGRIREIVDRYGYSDYRLHYLRKLSNTWARKHGRPMSETLRFPLPYGYTTGTHGSGERAARSSSRDEVMFDEMSPCDREHAHPVWGFNVPAVRMAIDVPLVVYLHTYVPLDEIREVRLTNEDSHTPYYADHWDDKRDVLLERGSYLHRYLTFRDFSGFPGFRKREQLPSLSDEQWEKCRTSLTEPHLSNLWLHDRDDHTYRRMKQAFIVAWEPKPEDCVLYEIVDADLPDRDPHVAAALWFAEYHWAKTLPSNVHRYQGDAIIERLRQIPVSPRQF